MSKRSIVRAPRRSRIPEAIQEGLFTYKRATNLWGPKVSVSEVYADLSARYVLPGFVRMPLELLTTRIDPIYHVTHVELANLLVPTGIPGADGYDVVDPQYRYAFSDELVVGDEIFARCVQFDVRRERELIINAHIVLHVAHEVHGRMRLCGSLVVGMGFRQTHVGRS